jgi:MinD superfamily P-loop ATPase
MTVAIASGKGGTGKTTVAVSLALSRPEPAELLDCDVEEPNAALFLSPRITASAPVQVMVPEVDAERCDACGACSRACRYHAIVSLRAKALVFPELCHGCGGCVLACPRAAISERLRAVGVVERGVRDHVRFAQGRLNVGEAMAVPVIRALRERQDGAGLTIVDAPPGTSCPVVAAVRGSDVVILVTEPTPFGLNDLALAAAMVRQLGIPCGVVINRSDSGDDSVRAWCAHEGISILLEIPEDRRIAEAYSRGIPAIEARPELRGLLRVLHERALALAGAPRVAARSEAAS